MDPQENKTTLKNVHLCFKLASVTITNAIRLGQKSTKPRLLKISLSKVEEKIAILKSKTNLHKP